jgi:hypothetical protein
LYRGAPCAGKANSGKASCKLAGSTVRVNLPHMLHLALACSLTFWAVFVQEFVAGLFTISETGSHPGFYD